MYSFSLPTTVMSRAYQIIPLKRVFCADAVVCQNHSNITEHLASSEVHFFF